MAIGDDFTIDYVNLRIVHSSTASTVYTVNELYSYLQDTFDELDQMDDPVPMSAQTPQEYSLINGWFMTEARDTEGNSYYRNCFEYLKEGAITTDGQDSWVIHVVSIDAGVTDAVNGDLGLDVTDDGTTVGPLVDYYVTSAGSENKWWIRDERSSPAVIAVGSTLAVASGTGTGTNSVASTSGESLWANVYTLGSIEQSDPTSTAAEQIYIEQNSSRYASGSEWWPEDKNNSSTRHIDILIKVKESDAEIDGAEITVYLRNYPDHGDADLYDHFGIDLSAGGRNAVPLATSVDLNNTTASTTVATYSGIEIVFVNGTLSYDAISGSFTEFETVTWTGGSGIFLYQTTTTGSGVMTLGNVTSDYPLNTETVTGATSSATAGADANMTAAYNLKKGFQQQDTYEYSVIIDCNSFTLAGVYEYLKYITKIGSTFTMYPTTTSDSSTTWTTKQGQLYIRAHEDTQTSPDNTFSPVKASPFGTFAGGTFFGAQGVWIQDMASADVQNYQLIDSNGTTRTPPTQASITISNLVSGDRVSVFRTISATQDGIDKDIYTAAANNTTASTTFVVNETISQDTPSSGTIRVVDVSDTSSNRETRYSYSTWTSSTFTLSSGSLGRTFTQTSDTAYVPFIDQNATQTSASVTVLYTSDRSIIVRVRRKASTAILPFEVTGTFSSSGYSTNTIRTLDTIVS